MRKFYFCKDLKFPHFLLINGIIYKSLNIIIIWQNNKVLSPQKKKRDNGGINMGFKKVLQIISEVRERKLNDCSLEDTVIELSSKYNINQDKILKIWNNEKIILN